MSLGGCQATGTEVTMLDLHSVMETGILTFYTPKVLVVCVAEAPPEFLPL